jgi:hypothetical protein
MEKKTIGGSKQAERTIVQREQTGNCKYCGKTFTRLMFPGPNPMVCENCLDRYEEIQRELARERMRRIRAERKAQKKPI